MWITVTPAFFSDESIWPESPTEYGSWKSIDTTFLTCRLLTMNFASVEPCWSSRATSRKNAGVPISGSPGVEYVRSVWVADGETDASPAAKNGLAVAPASPEVDGPSTATTLLSAMYFCASASAGAGPSSTGVSPSSSLTFRPYFGASVFTAYFAQVACSWPRKPAPCVSGVMKGRSIVLLQLSAAVDTCADVRPPWAVAATTVPARTAKAIAIAFFIALCLLAGGTGGLGNLSS